MPSPLTVLAFVVSLSLFSVRADENDHAEDDMERIELWPDAVPGFGDEFVHKDPKLENWMGGLLLSSVTYAGLKVEHVRAMGRG